MQSGTSHNVRGPRSGGKQADSGGFPRRGETISPVEKGSRGMHIGRITDRAMNGSAQKGIGGRKDLGRHRSRRQRRGVSLKKGRND